ncbi:methyl-accepting chemotaxis protein [Geothrix limicola]|uniref:methyl-accepting chemotaxis protein n=1 Tax=Geothrix limicola TaxID=2927978 RepID=UPI002556FC71|nr:methyl-accepting chemotaxis protein [Geothrix limicola]
MSGSRIPRDLAGIPLLGVVAYLLFRYGATVGPAEGALLIMAAAGFHWVIFRWWDWHRELGHEGPLLDWVQRILQGERHPMVVPEGLRRRDALMAAAMNAVLEDIQNGRTALAELRQASSREWRELDTLLASIQEHHAAEAEIRAQGGARLKSLGQDLKAAIEGTLRFDQIELNHRLRADQFRLQGQAFQGTLEQLRAGLDQFENLLEELQDSFPRLRREEDALGRLADAGLRQGSRLTLSVKGLVAHTPRLMDGTQARMEWLRRLRQTADGVRDKTEALARRLDTFREEAQSRIHYFGGAQGNLKDIDHVAQQTGLLAVNAAILAQQDGGSPGLSAIGGRLRILSDQTAGGVSGLERMLDEYQRGLERETAGLWDLQEVTQNLLSDVHDLLRTAGHLDQQGYDLERVLETHLGLVDHVRQTSERAELSLHEVGERAMALESAHVRQWGVEAKIGPERERLSRLGTRLADVGEGLSRISQQNIDEIWDILARHQAIRRADAYQQVTSEGLPHLLDEAESAESTWNGVAWARAQRRRRRVGEGGGLLPPMGHRDPNGGLRLLLLGQDALHNPEPSALERWTCDASGRFWDLSLMASLRTESHRLALLALLKESALSACFPDLDLRISPEGARIRLPHPYPGLPGFLAGLRLELMLEPELWDHAYRDAAPVEARIQGLIWLGPGEGGGIQSPCMRLAHAWIGSHDPHESFLSWLPYEGPRPPSPWLGDSGVEERLPAPLPLRCLGLGADPAVLGPMRDRLIQAGAIEGPGGAALCAVDIGHAHPDALLLRLFQSDAHLAGAFHPELVPYQVRMRDEVLGGCTGDPYRAAWAILDDLQRAGWLMPLPLHGHA